VRTEFGKGRVKVHAIFDGGHYDSSIVNMEVKNADGRELKKQTNTIIYDTGNHH